MDNLWLAITCQRNFQGIDSMSRLLESFQLSMFLENRSTIATRSRKYFCSGMVVISVAQTWSATLTSLRSIRQVNRTERLWEPLRVASGQSRLKPWQRMKFRTQSWLVGRPSLARYSTIRLLPLHGSSRSIASILAIMRSFDFRTGLGR